MVSFGKSPPRAGSFKEACEAQSIIKSVGLFDLLPGSPKQIRRKKVSLVRSVSKGKVN